jgi:anti-sigma regulatory factor (Ser/Thr protein kinase)
MPTVELQISALPVHVRTARLVAAALGRRLGLDAVTIDEVKLAVGEACSRAVGMHIAAEAPAPIVVQFQDDDQILEIRVLDCGEAGTRLPAGVGVGEALGGLSPETFTVGDDLFALTASSSSEPPELEQSVEVAGLASRLGLAVLAGLVDDMSVTPRNAVDEPGSVVTMRWPIVSFA